MLFRSKLSRSQGLTVLREVQAQLAGRASVQLMSSLKRTGLDEARAFLKTHGAIVVKPLHGNGGKAIFRVGEDGAETVEVVHAPAVHLDEQLAVALHVGDEPADRLLDAQVVGDVVAHGGEARPHLHRVGVAPGVDGRGAHRRDLRVPVALAGEEAVAEAARAARRGEGVTADETVALFLADGHSEDEIEEVLKEN